MDRDGSELIAAIVDHALGLRLGAFRQCEGCAERGVDRRVLVIAEYDRKRFLRRPDRRVRIERRRRGRSQQGRSHQKSEKGITPRHPPTVIARSRRRRSEEHTSELQSLMRISYAVFCLKKKKQNN